MTPACLINPVDDLIVYKSTSLGSFSVVGSAEVAAKNWVIAHLPDHPQGQVPDKYKLKQVMKQTQYSIDPQTGVQLAQLFRIFSNVFSESGWDVRKCDLVQHKIDFYPGSKPVNLANRQFFMHFEKDQRQKINKIFERKLITPSQSPYCSPAIWVRKKNSKPWCVIDYRQWSKQTAKSCWPLPSIDENFDILEGVCYFSNIGMSWGFH